MNIVPKKALFFKSILCSLRALLIMFSTVCCTIAACLCFFTEFEHFIFSFSYFSQLFAEIICQEIV